MELLFKIILIIHITGGTLSLLGAPVALAVHKGNKTHRTAGKIFFWGMTMIFVTAIYMSIYHNIPFLFMVGIFSYQMVVTGRRTLLYKTAESIKNVPRLDWFIVIVSFISDVCLICYGLFLIIAKHDFFGIVAIVFGSVGLQLVYISYKKFNGRNLSKTAWLFNHIGNMIGGYIAAVTAFLVVNINTNYPVLLWLAPTVVGGGVITYFFSYYKKKLAGGKPISQLVSLRAVEYSSPNLNSNP